MKSRYKQKSIADVMESPNSVFLPCDAILVVIQIKQPNNILLIILHASLPIIPSNNCMKNVLYFFR